MIDLLCPIDNGIEIVKTKVNQYKKPFLYCNLVGGQDDLVFDGQSFGYTFVKGGAHGSGPRTKSGLFKEVSNGHPLPNLFVSFICPLCVTLITFPDTGRVEIAF